MGSEPTKRARSQRSCASSCATPRGQGARPELVGLARASARAARKLLARGWPTPGKTGAIRTSALEDALFAHLGYTEQELIALGVDPSRAPSVRVAAIIMLQILELLEVEEAYVSDKGLRDGVALELYRQSTAQRHDEQPAAAYA